MIKAAIIGTGAISDSHIEGYLTYPDRCKIVALVDINVDGAKAKAEKFGLKDAAVLADYNALADLPEKPDVVSICLPPALHCAVSVAMLNAGINVICEKPLAPTLEECDKMLEAERASCAKLMVVAQNRFKPDCVKAKKLLDSGLTGKLLSAVVTSLWYRGENYYNLSWRGRWATEGGGCTLIHGIHHLDLMLYYMGEVESVTAIVDNLSHGNSEVEDISAALVRFKNGSRGTVISSLLHHGEEQRLMLDAEKASVNIPFEVNASNQLENGFPEENTELMAEINSFLETVKTDNTGHTALIDNVLTALETGTEPAITGEDGRRVIELISAMYQSAFTGKTVTLPMTAADPFYTKDGIVAGAVKFHEKTVSVEGFKNNTIQVGGTI